MSHAVQRAFPMTATIDRSASAADDPNVNTLVPAIQITFQNALQTFSCHVQAPRLIDLASVEVHPVVDTVMKRRMGEATKEQRVMRSFSDWVSWYHCEYGERPSPRVAPRLAPLTEIHVCHDWVKMVFTGLRDPSFFWMTNAWGTYADQHSMSRGQIHRFDEGRSDHVQAQEEEALHVDTELFSMTSLINGIAEGVRCAPLEICSLIASYVPNYLDILIGHGMGCRYGFSLVRVHAAASLTK